MSNLLFRDKHMRRVSSSITVLVLQHNNGTTCIDSKSLVVVNSLRQPEASLSIEIHCHWGINEWRSSPEFYLKVLLAKVKSLYRNSLNVPILLGKGLSVGSSVQIPSTCQLQEKQIFVSAEKGFHIFAIMHWLN